MHTPPIAGALLASLAWPGAVLAESSMEGRLQKVEQRMRYLEQRVAEQDKVIQAKDEQIAELTGQASSDSTGGWFERVEFGGVVEVEAGRHDPYQGDSSSDVVLATVELGMAAQVNDWVEAEVVLLYEEDETDLEVDAATITVAPPDGPWSLTGGRFYVPFGVFGTNLVSDPMTLELAETRESAAQIGFESDGLFAAVYAFNGDNKKDGDDKINNFGAVIGVEHEGETVTAAASLGYINDIGDSDSLQDVIADNLGNNDVDDYVSAWTLTGLIEVGSFSFIGEYVKATDSFDAAAVPWGAGGAEPEAWGVEAAYRFTLANRAATFAVGYQGTDEALALELPETRLAAAITVEIFDATTLSFEWAHDKDYGNSDGGTGNHADTLTGQLAVAF